MYRTPFRTAILRYRTRVANWCLVTGFRLFSRVSPHASDLEAVSIGMQVAVAVRNDMAASGGRRKHYVVSVNALPDASQGDAHWSQFPYNPAHPN